MFRRFLQCCVMACLSIAMANTSRIEELLAAHQDNAAYDYARARFSRQAGSPSYDLWYGIAAARAEHPAESIFAFERVLMAQPHNMGARLELALAYMAMGKTDIAEEEFNRILALNPPPRVANRIHFFIEQIHLQQERKQYPFYFYFKTNGGYDSNVNSATIKPTVNIPIIGTLTLDDSALAEGSIFHDIGLDTGFIRPLGRHQWFGSLDVALRNNVSKHDMDLDAYTYLTGLDFRASKRQEWIFPVMFQHLTLGKTTYRHLLDWAVNYRYLKSPHQQWQFLFDAKNNVFPNEYQRSSMLYTLGGGIKWNPKGHSYVILGTQLYRARELMRQVDQSFNSRQIYGGGFTWDDLGKSWKPYIHLGYERVLYDNPSLIFGTHRRDHLLQAYLGFHYPISKRLEFLGEYRAIRQISTLPIDTYTRLAGQVGFTYRVF